MPRWRLWVCRCPSFSAPVAQSPGHQASVAGILRDGTRQAPRERTGVQRRRFSCSARYDLRLAALLLRAPLCPMPINAQGSIAIPACKSVDKARMPRDLRAQTRTILPPVANQTARSTRCRTGARRAMVKPLWQRGRKDQHGAPCRERAVGDGPQPPQVQRMRWQTRCAPSTTQRAGAKRHTRQVKADRHPR